MNKGLPKRKWVISLTAIILMIFQLNLTANPGNRITAVKPNPQLIKSHIITGIVTSDYESEPLPGANVLLKGTKLGTITDENGTYSLATPDGNGILVISFMGFITKEVPINGQAIINIELKEDLQGIDEIVVVGYGSVKKKDITGAVSSVSNQDFGDRSATDLASLLQGKVAGVEVTSGQIRVRGVTTFNNTDPLYVIDGYTGGDLGTIHPNDIESIEILKDASSTAIYGARGANGVVLITSKKGKSGAPKIEFSSYWGISYPSKQLQMLHASDYMELLKDIELNGGTKETDLYALRKLFTPSGAFQPYVLTDRTDWQKQIFHSGLNNEYSMNIRGGSEKALYSLSSSYDHRKEISGTLESKDFKLGFNSEFRFLSDKIKIGEHLRVQYLNKTGRDTYMTEGLRMPPYAPVKDTNALGGYSYVTTTDDLNDASNPQTDLNAAEDYSKAISLMGNAFIEIHLFNCLKINSSIGLTGNAVNQRSFIKPRQNGNLVFPDAELDESFGLRYAPRSESYMTFDKTSGNHSFTVMVGNTYENYQTGRDSRIHGIGFINDQVRIATVARDKSVVSNNEWHNSYLSYFGRINYSLSGKYLFTFNFRQDASPKFNPENRWGRFPSIAFGWKLNEENFMKDLTWISQFKIRTGYGVTGNDQINPYGYFSSVHSLVSYAFPSLGYGAINYNGATIIELANHKMKWEETKNTSLGVDLGFFNDKFEINLDYFIKKTNDILFGIPLPPSMGMGYSDGGGDPVLNAASCENKGFEFAFSYKNKTGKVEYSITTTGTFVKNKVTSLGLGKPYNSGYFGNYSSNRTEVGFPIGYFYGYKMDKVYSTQAEVDADNFASRITAKTRNPGISEAELANIYYNNSSTSAGDIRFKDLNGDGIITDDDRGMIGNSIPKFNFGLAASAFYKGFDIFMNWTGVMGNHVLYQFGYYVEGMIRPFNATTGVLNRWKSEADPGNGLVPRAVKTDPSINLRISDRFIYKGDYARLKLISIGYSIPKSILNKISSGSTDKFRIYISSDNLLTFAKYPGYNPEIGGSMEKGGNLDRGVDYGFWPVDRTIRFGFAVNF